MTQHRPSGLLPTDTGRSDLTECQFLDFTAHPGTIDAYNDLTRQSIGKKQKVTVFYHNLHSLYSYFTSTDLRRCYDKALALVDGMPVIWLLQLGGFKVSREQRVTYVDFIWPMLEQARDNDWRVYHLGQSSDVQTKALDIIRQRLPGLQIDGHDGYFDLTANGPDSIKVINAVNSYKTDLLLVGFGAPKQEMWVDAHRDKIDAPALFTCGACMEYVAGHVKTPPRWLGKLGLEWSYRLLGNPRRFAFRYVIEPLLLSVILMRNKLFQKRHNP